MLKYLIRAFAVIGLMVTVSVAIGALSAWMILTRPVTRPTEPDTVVLDLDLTQPVVEAPRQLDLDPLALMNFQEETQLLDIIRAIDRAKDDAHVKGLVAKMGTTQPNLAQVQEIRDALARFRATGKFTYVYAPNFGEFGGGNRAYYLASAFETLWLQPVGSVSLTGIGLEAPFGKSALDKIGVSGDFMRRDEYKSVMENVTRDEFSPAVRSNMQAMIGSMNEQLVTGIGDSRKIASDKMRALMADGPYVAAEALKAGLVSHIGYEDDMWKEVEGKAGKDVKRADLPTYLSYAVPKNEAKGTIAIINGLGMISDEKPNGPSRFARQDSIDTDLVAKAFDDAVKDKDVRAILFRVDSPGGSPSASETIRHALVKAKESKKPIFVSMGDVAASGGYWIAMNADRIIAEPGTITGSIGVVGGKFVFGGLWEKLGVKWDSIATADNAKMWSSLAPFTPKERERVNALLDDTYKTFLANVAEARKIPPEKMPDIAKGRVWTGEQAVKVGLVDALGGLQTTLAALKKELKLEPTDKVALKYFPRPESPFELVIRIVHHLGLESAALGQSLGVLQKLTTSLGPVMDDMAYGTPRATRLPPEWMHALRP